MMIMVRRCCALHEVGLSERLSRIFNRNSGRFGLPAQRTPSDRIKPLRPISAVDRAARQ